MTETQERFLRTVLTRVPLDSVVELHLFPPIRRGTLETGVAVIATRLPPAPVALVVDEPTLDTDESAEGPEAGAAASVEPAVGEDGNVIEAGLGDEPAQAEAGFELVGEDEAVQREDEPSAPLAEIAAEGVVETMAASDADDDTVQIADASDASQEITEADIDAMLDGEQEPELEAVPVAPVPSPRMRILTAAYRHTIKGVERGKWMVDVQEEADAPLDAVELVLRGVRHRSTEPADPEMVTHDALAALLTPAAVAPAA